MANREACELYIEQEIKDGLEQGKKPYSIGKELSTWIEKLFEVSIKPATIEKRAQRIEESENKTNVLEPVDRFLIKAKSLAKLANKIKSDPSFESRKKELLSAANLVAIVLTETREDVKWI